MVKLRVRQAPTTPGTQGREKKRDGEQTRPTRWGSSHIQGGGEHPTPDAGGGHGAFGQRGYYPAGHSHPRQQRGGEAGPGELRGGDQQVETTECGDTQSRESVHMGRLSRTRPQGPWRKVSLLELTTANVTHRGDKLDAFP